MKRYIALCSAVYDYVVVLRPCNTMCIVIIIVICKLCSFMWDFGGLSQRISDQRTMKRYIALCSAVYDYVVVLRPCNTMCIVIIIGLCRLCSFMWDYVDPCSAVYALLLRPCSTMCNAM